MKNLKSYEIRQMWLDFFKSKGHLVEPSASLVPQNDKTLLWTNAGVTPLKKYFDGSVRPECPRITNAQKCIRTNDIENVGKTARHHTFFEMLGNFSIGDYFRNEVLPWAFELLTSKEWFDIDPEKLYITYYPDDHTTRDLWIKCGMNPSHLIPLLDNFWEIGEGPCGPDTEIFFDRGEKWDSRGKELIEQDIENDRFIEVWNIVFSQYNSKIGVDRKDYKELPHKNIDTGSGLERLCCVMQGTDTNYETDLFMPLINKVEEISGVKYNGQMAFKVIADHVRTVTFAVADGATMSNEGRGYVLRRVLRRAVKYAKSLGINKPFMAQLVDVVIDIMDPFYPYLHNQAQIVKNVITQEETKFLSTIEKGEAIFNEYARNAKNNNNIISGTDAFKLFDTYGFPYELTEEYAEESGLSVDKEGFNKAMDEQKERARSSRKTLQSMKGQNEAWLNFKETSEFVGYTKNSIKSKVIAVFDNGIVLDKTPFYALSGGQVCDKGTIQGVEVIDVIKMPNGQHLHILEENTFNVGDLVEAIIDVEYRNKIRKNHSSAHLFQAALQNVLGSHVHQQGSLDAAEFMRFDFNNYSNLTEEDIIAVEDLVNTWITEGHDVVTEVLPIEEAKKKHAMMLFDDKYGNFVRVVEMGVSTEFCGGTHVSNTSQISDFEIVSIESIGSGIFRGMAYTGDLAFESLQESLANKKNDLNTIISKGKNIVEEAKKDGIVLSFNDNFDYGTVKGYRYVLKLNEHIKYVSDLVKELDKEYQAALSKKALSNLDSYESLIENNSLIIKENDKDTNTLKDLASALLNKYNLNVCFISNISGGKLSFVCAASGAYNAGQIVKCAAQICGGNGGGKPNMAQAGGKDTSKLDEAINSVKDLIK